MNFFRYLLASVAVALVMTAPSDSHAKTFVIDPGQSQIIFKIQELSDWTVGGFTGFSGEVTLDDATAQLNGFKTVIDLATVNTRQTQRDEDLRGPDLFNTEKFPTATFTTKTVTGDTLTGDLSFRGVTKPVTLSYHLKPPAKDPSGRQAVTLSAQGNIRPKDFGITYNRILENNKPLLGDTVEIVVEVTGVLQ